VRIVATSSAATSRPRSSMNRTCADVLRAEGVKLVEFPGWRDRGHGDFKNDPATVAQLALDAVEAAEIEILADDAGDAKRQEWLSGQGQACGVGRRCVGQPSLCRSRLWRWLLRRGRRRDETQQR